jgi:hypothetical protein
MDMNLAAILLSGFCKGVDALILQKPGDVITVIPQM